MLPAMGQPDELDLKDPEYRDDPHPLFARLRKRAPLVHVTGSPVRNAWLVTRYQDVQAALKDPRIVNDARNAGQKHSMDAWWIPRVFATMQDSMLNADPPEHRRLRNLVQLAFTPGRVREVATRVQKIVDRQLDRVHARGEMEIIADLALPLPLTIISEMMGVPEADRLNFSRWMQRFTTVFSGGRVNVLIQLPNGQRLLRLFRRLIASRRTDPGDDLISALVQAEQDGQRLSADELLSMVFLLLLAGHETTVNLIGTGTLALLDHPEQLALLRQQPELVDSAVEELLRYSSPIVYGIPRFVAEDLELAGQSLVRGTALFPGIASANRDESVFDTPDRLDLTRAPNKHLSFGLGIHYCLGAPLARLEASIAFRTLVSRYPDLRLAIPRTGIRWRTPANFRGLAALPVRLR